MGIVTRKQLLRELLPGLKNLFGMEYVRIEYHARRTEHDPKLWRVLEITLEGSEKVSEKELATDLKRNRAQALVKLLRSNQKHGS